jgi:hypothetical protein
MESSGAEYRSVQCLARRRNAGPCGLVGANTAHDEPAPAGARERISFPPYSTSFLWHCGGPHAGSSLSVEVIQVRLVATVRSLS